jgi:hypothetical protein
MEKIGTDREHASHRIVGIQKRSSILRKFSHEIFIDGTYVSAISKIRVDFPNSLDVASTFQLASCTALLHVITRIPSLPP